jgi:hypothetical protein
VYARARERSVVKCVWRVTHSPLPPTPTRIRTQADQLELKLGTGAAPNTAADDDGDSDGETDRYRARGGPRKKFVCYHEELGSGAYKTVYKGMDVEEAIEVAWNEMKVQRLSQAERKRLDDEVCRTNIVIRL